MVLKTNLNPEHGLLLNNTIEHWATVQPQQLAMEQHEDGKQLSYQQFSSYIDLFALRLLDSGFTKGDRLATQLPLIPEHVIFMYACFKIGVIIAPLDLRLKEAEGTKIDKLMLQKEASLIVDALRKSGHWDASSSTH